MFDDQLCNVYLGGWRVVNVRIHGWMDGDIRHSSFVCVAKCRVPYYLTVRKRTIKNVKGGEPFWDRRGLTGV